MQSLTVRPAVCARPMGARVAARPAARPSRVVMMSAPKKEAIEAAIKEAEESCAGGASGEW